MSLQSDPAKMVDAALERPQGPLSERVSQCLRSRVIGTKAAAEVCQEIRAIRPDLAAKFWRMMGQPTRHDEVEIVSIVADVKALELPAPVPAVAPRTGASGVPAWPLDPAKLDPLSEGLERTFGIRKVGAEA